MGDLISEDIRLDILARLPVISLIRFRCVCKKWKSLISDPRFVNAHLKMSMQQTSSSPNWLLLTDKNPSYLVDHKGLTEGDATNIRIKEIHQPVQVSKITYIAGSCNGLVCLRVGISEGFIVWNPSTGEGRVLPPSLFPHFEEDFYGLGYDSLTDDYKFIRGHNHLLRVPNGIKKVTVEIFSFKSSSWKKVEYEVYFLACDLGCLGVYLDGSLHWLLRMRNTVASFNLAEEKFYNVIALPSVSRQFSPRCLGVLGEYMFVISMHYDAYDQMDQRYEAWIMKLEHGKMLSWIKLCHFSKDVLPTKQSVLFPISPTKDGKVVFHCGEREFCIFDPEENTGRICKLHIDHEVWLRCVPHVGSLVSPFAAM